MARVTYDDFGMVYQALLFSTDEKASRVVSQILRELEFQVEACAEPFAAVKQITNQHYDAIVVDCDTEQNAALLFKSARNSNSNSGSLAVALVQGQGGIAKAFRIGANLVLTKPIQAEQSKGTLRTAKGLLRKAEAAKSSSTAASLPKVDAVPALAPPEPPLLAAFSVSSAASGTLELQAEQFPELGPAEAALLESMPEPSPLPSLSAASGSQANGWQSSAKSTPEPMAVQSLAGGAASAAAPAKSIAPEATADEKSIAEEPAIQKQDVPDQKKKSGKSQPSSQRKSVAKSPAPAEDELPIGPFAGGDVTPSQQGDSKKNFAIAAVLVLAAAGALYYGWPQLAPLAANVPILQRYLAPQTPPSAPARPAAQPAGTPSQGAENTPSEGQPSSVPGIGQTAAPGSSAASPVAAAANQPATAASAADNSSSPNQHPLHLAPDVAAALLAAKVEPVYPPSALQQRLEGSVELQATIGKDGSASDLKVLSGKPPLTTAAAAAVRQWKYKPYQINGQPTEFQTEITVDFKAPQQ